MASTKKLSETGWFYHAPAKPVKRDEPVPVPPASQIPGLSDLTDVPPEEPKKALILETDSPYIRMAKMGGRPDLLRFHSPKPASNEPKPYPRNDWFYMEDIAMEDNSQQNKKSDYVFTLPDYMVHNVGKNRKNSQNANYSPARLPYAFDKTTVYERQGDQPCDKTVAIEEARPHGYGVRAQKQHGKPVKAKYPMPVQERGKAPPPQYDDGIPKAKPMRETKEEAHPPMSKILSNGYAKDWEEEREQWEASQKKSDGRGKIERSEYQSSMAAGTKPARAAGSAKSANSQRRTSGGRKKSGM